MHRFGHSFHTIKNCPLKNLTYLSIYFNVLLSCVILNNTFLQNCLAKDVIPRKSKKLLTFAEIYSSQWRLLLLRCFLLLAIRKLQELTQLKQTHLLQEQRGSLICQIIIYMLDFLIEIICIFCSCGLDRAYKIDTQVYCTFLFKPSQRSALSL